MPNESVKNSIISHMVANKSVAIFDFDGTLADTELYHKKSFIYTLRELGVSLEPFPFEEYVGKSEQQVFEEISERGNITLDIDLAKKIRIEYFIEQALHSGIKPYPHIRDIVTGGYAKSIIVSNQKADVIEKLLKVWELDKYIDELISCCVVNTDKTKEIVRLSRHFKDLDISVIHYEDSASYIEISRALNNKTVFVQHEYNCGRVVSDDVDWFFDMTSTRSGN